MEAPSSFGFPALFSRRACFSTCFECFPPPFFTFRNFHRFNAIRFAPAMPAIVTLCNKPHCLPSSDYPPIILRLSSDQDSSEVFGSDEGRRHVPQHFRRRFALRKIVGRVRSRDDDFACRRVVIVLRRGAGPSSADAACRFASSTAQSSVASVLEDFHGAPFSVVA